MTGAGASRAGRVGFCAAAVALCAGLSASVGRAAIPASEAQLRARADALIARMTPEEKSGQLVDYFYYSGAAAETARIRGEIRAGRTGALLFQTDPEAINRLQAIAVNETRLHIPLLFGFDVIHGLRTILPVPIAMAATWDPAVVTQGQAVAAREARAVGIHWAFAPMVDIARDPRWGRIVEGAGEDPFLGSAMAAAQVRGFQGPFLGSPDHIIAGPKHFAGYGAALGGRDYDEANISDSDLWNVYLPPFHAAVEAGAGNIMSAYMGLNGVPASGNAWLLTHVLRDTWGFKGFVVTDAGAAADLKTHGFAATNEDAGVRALTAGVDIEMAPESGGSAFLTLPKSLASGAITQQRLDEAVRRVLLAKLRVGLFERPYVDVARARRVLADPASREVARRLAARSAVLLRNEGALLPLDRKAVKRVAVIGPLADSPRDTLGPWAFDEDDGESVGVLAGLRAKLGSGTRVDYAQGVNMPARAIPTVIDTLPGQKVRRAPIDDTAGIREAVALARGSDVAVLVLGEAHNMSGELASRSSLDLPGRQQELLEAVIATGKPVVVLLMSARPLDLKDARPRALMDVWYPGSQGGHAVADLLFGDADPGGKLPFTWVRNLGQIPSYYAHLTSHAPADAERRYWNEPSAPLHPFGFGLSYTTFSFADLRVGRPAVAKGQDVPVTVDVSNTGARAGDEVAQLYIHQRHGGVARPVRELKGFQRVTLRPGETRTLRFTLNVQDLSYWSAASHQWVQDATTFDVWVGDSSAATLAATVEVRDAQ